MRSEDPTNDRSGDARLVPLAVSSRAAAAAIGRIAPRHDSAQWWGARVSDDVDTHARLSPGRTAFIGAGGETTYRKLRDLVARVRALLLAHGCRQGDRVVVSGPRSVNTAVAFLALESIGATYVPVDETWPSERLSHIFAQVGCAYVLGHNGRSGRGAWVPAPPLARAAVEMGVRPLDLARAADHTPRPPSPATRPDDPGRQARYVIYTSGSTGTPKGAVVEHRGMANHLLHMRRALGLRPDDVVAFNAPATYVVSMWQMLAALSAGATVAVIDEFAAAYPRRLLKAWHEHGVTVAQLVPTVMSLVVDELRRRAASDPLPRLRWLIATGEELRPRVAAGVLDTLPNTRLMNAYGMSECSDDVAQHVIRRADVERPRLPVGRPIANTALHVLVAQGPAWRPAGPGETGELFVAGLPVGAGYVDSAEARSAAFFHDSLHPRSPTLRLYRTGDLARVDESLVYCLGRVDRQVKIRGVRMELDEIEGMLGQHPSLTRCAVTAEAVKESHELLVHYVATDDVTPRELQTFLDAGLPAPAPTRWVRLVSMPLTGNGKTDYRALAASVPSRPADRSRVPTTTTK
ncbi:amino acid adenylation domain-containing protein [Streptomyces sp. NPDC014734]|uniref:amino acid adenylation domain-containing protein n=1 Tax=Streptomyces sp. NPDC014734 TaxID=3364886 RepID=UPI0036F67DA8